MSRKEWFRSLFLLAVLVPPGSAFGQRIDEIALVRGSGPAGLAVGSDGSIWFAEESGNRIGRLNASFPAPAALTEYALPDPDSRPHGVAAASDGILFTEGGGRTGRLTAGGALSEFPAQAGPPREIARGPFDQYWWSDPAHDALRSVDELGRGFFVETLAAGSRPEGVATGVGGDLWFAENGSARIGHLRRSSPAPGAPGIGSLLLEEHRLPDPTSDPWSVVLGPDGNVWFTEPAKGRVGRLDTATGQFTEIELPAGAEPRGIVAGLDRNVWLADAARDVIVRIGPDGAMREFPLPTRGSRPTHLAVAPDGNVWFSEAGTDRIGRLMIPPECSPDPAVLCVNGGRFQATVSYFFSSGPYEGAGHAVPLTGDAGAFWFFSANNLELIVKVVDGRPINGKFWVFAAALTDGLWLLEIRDSETGQIRRYQSDEGQMRSLADTNAF